MDFRKKLKTRLYTAIAYIVLGVMMIVGAFVFKTDNTFVSSFGLTLVVMGIVRIRNYFLITRTEESIRKQQIAETDERNISIIHKARSTTFSVYVFLSCLVVIVLSFLQMHEAVRWLSLSVLLLILIYWISYFVYRKKL